MSHFASIFSLVWRQSEDFYLGTTQELYLGQCCSLDENLASVTCGRS